MNWVKDRIFDLRLWWRAWHPFKNADSNESRAFFITILGYQIMVMAVVECLGLTIGNALGLSLLSVFATGYIGVLGFALYLFLVVKQKEMYGAINPYILFYRYAILRLAISFTIGWILGFTPSTLLPQKAGMYIGLTDKHFESEGGDSFDEPSTSYTVGDMAIVFRRDITDSGIDQVNKLIGAEDEHDYFLRRSKNGRFSYVGQYDRTDLSSTCFLFWQTAVSKGYVKLPEGSHHDKNDFLGIFIVAPFAILEFLIKEVPYAILIALFLWMFRAGIAPSKFLEPLSEPQEFHIYYDEEE